MDDLSADEDLVETLEMQNYKFHILYAPKSNSKASLSEFQKQLLQREGDGLMVRSLLLFVLLQM